MFTHSSSISRENSRNSNHSADGEFSKKLKRVICYCTAFFMISFFYCMVLGVLIILNTNKQFAKTDKFYEINNGLNFWRFDEQNVYKSYEYPTAQKQTSGRTNVSVSLDKVTFYLNLDSTLKINYFLQKEWIDERLKFEKGFSKDGKYPEVLNMKRIVPAFTPWTPKLLIMGGNNIIDRFEEMNLSPSGKVYQLEYKSMEMKPLFHSPNNENLITFSIKIMDKMHFDHEVQYFWEEIPINLEILKEGQELEKFKLFSNSRLTNIYETYKFLNATSSTCVREGNEDLKDLRAFHQCLRVDLNFLDVYKKGYY